MTEQPGRWIRASVYPDMWVDPDDDPRNSDGPSPDGELPTLLEYLADYRVTLRMYADLEREQAATDAALAEHADLGERLKDGTAVRELMVHRIEEYARGHADLLRECADGRAGQ